MSSEKINDTSPKLEERKSEASEEKEDCDDDCQYIFPQRLMSVLADEANHESICWLPHGRAFIIRNRSLFAEKVMPRFFPRKSKYSSFTRKLNRWNFTRVSSGPELGAYYHEFFLRDQPHLAAQMFCKNARTKIAMASAEPEPTALHNQLSKGQAAAPAPEPSRLDSSHVLMDTTADPTLQLLLSQQMNMCNQLNIQQRLAQLQLHHNNVHKPMAGIGLNNNSNMNNSMNNNLNNNAAALNLLMGTQNASTSPVLGTWLQNEIMAQKQQQERMLQLRQLTAVNLRQQSSKPSAKKNFRASAA
ncbi:unnamed protein product [Cylindrotheca closterium]|uniref:HSF-type DNA-binding domain-containing protein n=1 Tax=Cylindrotheca closterium TaxID=2856 RepID=A0AAD2FC84_9STRA|nr:unnamed protein product [Cylindrotheca closterium]